MQIGLHLLLSMLALTAVGRVFSASAQETTTTDQQAPVVVFRIAGHLLEDYIERTVTQEVPIRTQLLDAWCVGTATATANVTMDFAKPRLGEPLPIHVSGIINSRTLGYTGPVVVTAKTKMKFTGLIEIVFDGREFHHVSQSAKVTSKSKILCVDTKRDGVGSRLIRGLAKHIAPRQVPEYDAAGACLARTEILTAMSDAIPPILAELNDQMRIEQTLASLAMLAGYEREISKTATYIQSRVAPKGRSEPVPPQDEMFSDAQIKIWVYPKSKRPLLGDIDLKWQQTLTGIPNPLNIPLPKLPLSDAVKMSVVGDWDVIQISQLQPKQQ